MTTDDISDPGAWERELSMRPKIHPALREHVKEHAQLWQYVQHDGGCAVWHSGAPCDCGLAELLEVTK